MLLNVIADTFTEQKDSLYLVVGVPRVVVVCFVIDAGQIHSQRVLFFLWNTLIYSMISEL